jgi:hypothetical protein
MIRPVISTSVPVFMIELLMRVKEFDIAIPVPSIGTFGTMFLFYGVIDQSFRTSTILHPVCGVQLTESPTILIVSIQLLRPLFHLYFFSLLSLLHSSKSALYSFKVQ